MGPVPKENPGGRRERIDRGVRARAADIYALDSWREALYLLGPWLGPLAVLLVWAAAASPYEERILTAAAMQALLAMSWDLLASVGLISLGQALFFGLGAYLAGMLDAWLGWPWWLVLPAASLGGGVLSALLLAPAIRLRGIYFSMVTLVLPLALVRVIEATGILGGTVGIGGLGGLPGAEWELWLGLGAMLAALLGLRRFMGGDHGRVLLAVRDDDLAVAASGVSVFRLKFLALWAAGSLGALAGAFLTEIYLYVGMPAFALDNSILPIAAAVVGGKGTLAGPVLGAFLLVPLSEALRPLGALRIVAYGLFLVGFVALLPEGLFPFIRRRYHQMQRWKGVGHD